MNELVNLWSTGLTRKIQRVAKSHRVKGTLMLSILSICFAIISVKANVDGGTDIDYVELPAAVNLQQDAELRKSTGMTIMVYVSAPDCPYCTRLEEEVIKPLLRSGDYTNKLILRNMNWDSSVPVVDFQGVPQEPGDFLLKYNIIATPTLLFLNSDGSEAAKRITGYQGSDFFWYYLDRAIQRALL